MPKHFMSVERKIERAIKHGRIPRYYYKNGMKMKTNPYALARHVTGYYGTTNEPKATPQVPRRLVLTGKPAYIKHMFSHLKKEHPSTRRRMRII